jgi:hypothetical protein
MTRRADDRQFLTEGEIAMRVGVSSPIGRRRHISWKNQAFPAGPSLWPTALLARRALISGPPRRDGADSRPADPRWRGKVG